MFSCKIYHIYIKLLYIMGEYLLSEGETDQSKDIYAVFQKSENEVVGYLLQGKSINLLQQ